MVLFTQSVYMSINFSAHDYVTMLVVWHVLAHKEQHRINVILHHENTDILNSYYSLRCSIILFIIFGKNYYQHVKSCELSLKYKLLKDNLTSQPVLTSSLSDADVLS